MSELRKSPQGIFFLLFHSLLDACLTLGVMELRILTYVVRGNLRTIDLRSIQ